MHFLGQIGPLLIPELEAWARGQRAETARGGSPRLIVELDQAVKGQLGGSGVRGRTGACRIAGSSRLSQPNTATPERQPEGTWT